LVNAATLEDYALAEEAVTRALEYAGLDRSALMSAPHPDNGHMCLRLKADIQQYSAFVARLAVQHRAADDIAVLTDHVRLQYEDRSGDTLFWLPGVGIRTA
jgi:hypothetical protein